MILVRNQSGKKTAIDTSKIQYIEELRSKGSFRVGLMSGTEIIIHDIDFDYFLDVVTKENDKVVIEIE